MGAQPELTTRAVTNADPMTERSSGQPTLPPSRYPSAKRHSKRYSTHQKLLGPAALSHLRLPSTS